jgi:hypothetical protein
MSEIIFLVLHVIQHLLSPVLSSPSPPIPIGTASIPRSLTISCATHSLLALCPKTTTAESSDAQQTDPDTGVLPRSVFPPLYYQQNEHR